MLLTSCDQNVFSLITKFFFCFIGEMYKLINRWRINYLVCMIMVNSQWLICNYSFLLLDYDEYLNRVVVLTVNYSN